MPSITIQFSDNEANLIKQIAALNGVQHTLMVKELILNNVLDPVKESLLKHISELENMLLLARRIQNNEPLLWKDTDRFLSYIRSHNLNTDTDYEAIANLCQNLQDRLDFLNHSLMEEERIKSVNNEILEEEMEFSF